MFARTGSCDTGAVEVEDRAMAGAEDSPAIPCQVTIIEGRERPAGVRAGILEPLDASFGANDEAGEKRRALAEPKPPGSRLDDFGQGAQAKARRGSGRIRVRHARP